MFYLISFRLSTGTVQPLQRRADIFNSFQPKGFEKSATRRGRARATRQVPEYFWVTMSSHLRLGSPTFLTSKVLVLTKFLAQLSGGISCENSITGERWTYSLAGDVAETRGVHEKPEDATINKRNI